MNFWLIQRIYLDEIRENKTLHGALLDDWNVYFKRNKKIIEYVLQKVWC